MVKKFVKSMLALGLLLSISQFQLRSEDSAINFDSYLQPQDFEVLERNNEPMVFMAPDAIDLIASMNSANPEVRDLVEHIKMGHCVAPEAAVKQAVEEMMKSADLNATERSVLAEYQEALVNGEALIRQDLSRRFKKHGKFCDLFVKKSAVLGCAKVLGNLNVCGTISACNFTAFTGTTGGIVFPGLVVDGDIVFNEAGVNPLFAQGAVEAFLRNIRGSLALGTSTITLTSTAPNTAVTVGGGLPTASVFRGTGFTTGAATAAASSSGISGTTALGANTEFYYAVEITFPITFTTPYTVSPTIVLGFERAINGAPTITTPNASTVIGLVASNVTTTGALLTLAFNVTAQGATYAAATNNAAIAINSALASARLINFLCQGPVA